MLAAVEVPSLHESVQLSKRESVRRSGQDSKNQDVAQSSLKPVTQTVAALIAVCAAAQSELSAVSSALPWLCVARENVSGPFSRNEF